MFLEEFTAGLGNSEAVKAKVAKLLSVAKGVDTTGAAVSEIARSIVDTIVLPEQARGNPGGPDNPGPPENAGPPDGAGPPEDAGPPENAGKGKPVEPGQSGGQP